MSLSQSTAQRLLGTASAFASQNPIVANGQIACETDANKFKIGDGATHYNDLPYGNQAIVPTTLEIAHPFNIMLSLLPANGVVYKPSTVLHRLILGAYNFPVGLQTSPAPYADLPSKEDISLPLEIIRAGNVLVTGSINFAAGEVHGTYTFGSSFTSIIGDILTISTPEVLDENFGNISVTLALTTSIS